MRVEERKGRRMAREKYSGSGLSTCVLGRRGVSTRS